jgi:hypothetical protein
VGRYDARLAAVAGEERASAMSMQCPSCAVAIAPEMGSDGSTFTCPRSWCAIELELRDGSVRACSLLLRNHFSLCILPFSLPETDRGTAVSKIRASPRWTERIFQLDSRDDADRTEYFLPYVRRFLFPSLFEATTNGNESAARQSQPEMTSRRFRFDLARLGGKRRGLAVTLRYEDPESSLPFEFPLLIQTAELLLFSHNVGFLVLRLRSTERKATYLDQMNAIRHFRMVAPLSREFELPELQVGDEVSTVPKLVASILAELDPPEAERAVAGREALLSPAGLPVRAIYDDRMMSYTFSCIDKWSVAAGETACVSLIHRAAVVSLDRNLDRPAGAEEADNAWLRARLLGYSKDGGSLVVFNTNRYQERVLGGYWETYYFDVFLLAALQRVALLTLFERLSDIRGLTSRSRESDRRLSQVRLDLLRFKNQAWFSQITNRERGLELYRRWRDVLETQQLMDEVTSQAKELDDHLGRRARERVEWLMRLAGFLLGALSLVIGLDRLFPDEPWVTPVRLVLVAALVIGLVVAAFMALRRRSEAS